MVNAAHRRATPTQEPITFTLTEKTLESAECAAYSELPMKGFRLTMMRQGAKQMTLNDDRSLPESRGCALRYAIADIFSHESGGKTTYAVLLHMQTVGFEGPDSRFSRRNAPFAVTAIVGYERHWAPVRAGAGE